MSGSTVQAGKRATYPAYKPSGVPWLGDVPEHWQPIRLRYRARINPTRSELNGTPSELDVSFVPMESVHEYGGLTLDQTRPLTEVATGYTYFRDGDVLTAKITPCFENGKGSIANGLVNGIGFGTTELHVLRPCPELDRRFLFYVTISHAFRHLGAAEMYGAGGQKRVPDDFIRDFRQPIPSSTEQKAIAAFLDRETARIDALIEKKRRQIELLQEKRSALISHAVTKGLDPNAPMRDSGIEWVGPVPKHWDVVRVRRIGRVCQGHSFPHNIQGCENDDLPWYKVDDMNRPGNEVSMRQANNYVSAEVACAAGAAVLPAETIIFPRVGAALLTNKRRILACPAIVDDNVYAVIPSRIQSHYLYYLLSLVDFASLASSGLVPTITFGAVKDLLVPLPPYHEQEAITAHVDAETSRTDSLVDRVEQSIEGLRELRTALISAAVTGTIDVRAEVRG